MVQRPGGDLITRSGYPADGLRLRDPKAASLLTLQPPLLRLIEGAEQGSLPRVGRIALPSGRFVDDPNVFVRGLAQRLCLDLDDLIAVGRALHGGPAKKGP